MSQRDWSHEARGYVVFGSRLMEGLNVVLVGLPERPERWSHYQDKLKQEAHLMGAESSSGVGACNTNSHPFVHGKDMARSVPLRGEQKLGTGNARTMGLNQRLALYRYSGQVNRLVDKSSRLHARLRVCLSDSL